MKRRLLLAGGAAAISALALARLRQLEADGNVNMVVFVPSDEKPRTIERLLVGDMPTVSVTVFGKAKDLERGVSTLNPAAVLAPTPTLSALGLAPVLRGKRNGDTQEPYVLVTVDKKMPPKEMSAHTVGIYGIMGRTEMKRLCGELLGTGDQQIKTVTKYADLLPLLQFQATKGVVLPKRFASILTGRSELNLVVSDLPNGRVGLVSAAVRDSGSKSKVINSLKALGSGARQALGVDAWD